MAEARFAFQQLTAPTGNWNYIVSNSNPSTDVESWSAMSLIDIDTGGATGWTLAGTEISTVGDQSSAGTGPASGDAAWVDQETIKREAWSSATTARGLDLVFAGLDDGKTYTLEFYGYQGSSTGNVSAYTISGVGTLTLDSGSNETNVARFSSVSPSSGSIAVSWRRDNSAANGATISALRIIENEADEASSIPRFMSFRMLQTNNN